MFKRINSLSGCIRAALTFSQWARAPKCFTARNQDGRLRASRSDKSHIKDFGALALRPTVIQSVVRNFHQRSTLIFILLDVK